jgi:hypothetical protein
MNQFGAFAFASALLFPAVAFAQEPREAPHAPSVTPSPAASCRLGDADGFDAADARTAAQIVCREMARAGAPPGARYVVSLGKLGSATLLSVASEGDTPGSTADSQQMLLQGVEEVVVAAPRIAESIVKGKSLAETEKVDNLVAQDTRQPKSKSGQIHFALGMVGLLPPLDRGLTAAPGLVLDVHYETPSQELEIGGSARFGAGDDRGSATVSHGFFVFSAGGRMYASKKDFSPYIGGGLSWEWLTLRAPTIGFDADGSHGLGAYADAGVEILRTHHTHFALGARFDLPFFSLHNDSSDEYCYTSGCVPGAKGPRTLFYAPLSFELRLTF